jgi:ABC-type transport system substrate-binding protein
MRVAGAKTDGRLVRWFGTDPKGFNPLLENGADVQDGIVLYVGAALASRMAWTDPEKWQKELAERVEVTDEGRELTIYLRPGVRWQAPGNLDLGDARHAWLRGDHFVTARDVAFSLSLIQNPQVENGSLKNYYQDLESWRVIDDLTIVVRWKKTFCGAIEYTLGVPLVPEFFYAYDEDGTRFPDATLGARFDQHWYDHLGMVGAGPYRLVSYVPGTEIRLERNEDYFGEKPAIREIVYQLYADPNATLLKLKAHELSFGSLRPGQYRDEIKRFDSLPPAKRPKQSPFWNGDLRYRTYLDNSFYYIGWNADRPLFRDKRVRQAMTLAFDRARIVEHVFVGLGEVAVGPYDVESPFHDPDIRPWPYDPARARALLAEAGFADTDGDGVLDADLTPDDGDPTRTPFEFSLLVYNGSPEMESAANILKEDLLALGVRMRIESAEWSLMQKRMDEKDFDAVTGGWALSYDPDLYQIFHSSQADVPKGSNRVGFRNPEADRLMEQAREVCEPTARLAILRRLHRILHEEQPYSFFFVRRAVAAWWKEVERVEFAKLRPKANSLPWWVDTALPEAGSR